MSNTKNATLVLREEHHLIEKGILSLAWILKQFETGAVLDHRQIWEMSKSFRDYLERCHNVKEDFLLCMVRACQGSFARYPVQTFYDEHHRTQPLLAGLAKAAEEHSHSNGANAEALVRSLREVVDFYPGHIWKADNLLFPMADELLGDRDQRVLIQQFEWIESATGSHSAEQLSAIISEFQPQTVEPRERLLA